MSFEVFAFLVAVALGFSFLNGFHDAASSIATIVSTGAISPQWAIVWAAFFNFIAFAFFGLHVATTISKGLVDAAFIDHYLVFGALVGAISWNIVTWYHGIPSSSSHALVGGILGAGVAKAGADSIIGAGFVKIAVAIVIAPFVGFMLAAILMVMIAWISRRATPKKVDRWFQRLQLLSAAAYSLGHGSNDAQKAMGMIWMLLIAAAMIGPDDPLPFWVVISCQAAMGLGTLFGGWRIVKIMGQRITKLKPLGGFCASTSGACTLFLRPG